MLLVLLHKNLLSQYDIMFCNNRFYRTYLLAHAYKLYLIKTRMDSDSESGEGSIEQFRALPNVKSKVW